MGAALAVSTVVITSNDEISLVEIGRYINSTRAMAILAGILLSVILAFTLGTLVMYVSRAIFSFRYHTLFRRYGALWCGISFTAIVYFALFKGLQGVMNGSALFAYIDSHLALSLFVLWILCSILLFFLQMFGVNILKLNILAGTFSLALAFAGNDLVNFVGVPVAGYDSYMMARASGDAAMTMGGLATDASANILLLLAAGAIMIVTLWTSRRALSVSKTELSLSNQNEGEERYGSSVVSRGLVRAAMNVNAFYERIMPARLQRAVAARFEKLPEEEREGGSYDLIRATVNLTTASILISIATSLKLPLSTTYVCFMVSMGSSLADRAWGRESAVYRITGVMAVISGWFITALGGFLIALAVTALLLWGGWIAVAALTALCAWLLVRSHLKTPGLKEEAEKALLPLETAETPDEVLCACIGEVCTTMQEVTRIYNRTLVAVFKENRKVLKEMVRDSNRLFEEARIRKYNVMPTLRRLQRCDIDTGHFYVQVTDYLSEVTKALIHITRPAFEHIDNNHEGMSKEQIVDLMRVNDQVEAIFDKINDMLATKDFSDLDLVLEMRDKLFDTIVEAIKSQLRRINDVPSGSTRAGVLYLTILNETKTMMLQSRNLLKSQQYFLEAKK